MSNRTDCSMGCGRGKGKLQSWKRGEDSWGWGERIKLTHLTHQHMGDTHTLGMPKMLTR